MGDQSQNTQGGDAPSASQARVWEEILAALSGEQGLLDRGIRTGGSAQEYLHEAIRRVASRVADELPHDPAMLRQYILGAVRNIALQDDRRRSREKPAGLFPDSCHHGASDAGLRRLDEEEERIILERCLSGLRPTDRAVLMAVADGACVAELAKRLGKTPASIRSHLRCARRAARQVLALSYRPGRGPELRHVVAPKVRRGGSGG